MAANFRAGGTPSAPEALRAARATHAFLDSSHTANYQHAAATLAHPAARGLEFMTGGVPRASFEVHSTTEEDRLALRLSSTVLRAIPGPKPPQHQLAQRSTDSSKVANGEEQEALDKWRAQHPSVLQRLDDIMLHLRGKRLVVFLDYDGTLTPIVSNPDEAVLSSQMREVVRNVARLFPTAIISGRGREKVENFVQLRELYYAGSHGMDIAGPTMGNGAESSSSSQADIAFQPAAHFKPLIDAVYKELCERLASIAGSSVEHNNFCVSAHFRNCSADRWQEVVAVVEDIVARNPELRMTRGRKVVEVRPKVNWHKGTALEHLLDSLGLKGCPDVVAVYIGDDHTDEDAFKALRDLRQGFGVLVSTKVRETAAAYTVRDPSEVQLFLQSLVTWGLSEHNGWAAYAQRLSSQAQPAAANSHGQLSLSSSPALHTAAMPSS